MNKEEILKKLASGELEVEAASKLLAELDQPKCGSLYCKVSEKGRSAFTACNACRSPFTWSSGSDSWTSRRKFAGSSKITKAT